MAQQVRTGDLYRGGADDKSAGRLVKEVTEDMSTLVRKEIELAKQELGQALSAKIKGAVLFGVVAALGAFLLIFLLLAVRDGFAELWAPWIADLATSGVLVLVSIVVFLVGKRKLATPLSAELTRKNIREDVELVKSLGKR